MHSNKPLELLQYINDAKKFYIDTKNNDTKKFHELFACELTKNEVIYLYALSRYVQAYPSLNTEDLKSLIKLRPFELHAYKNMIRCIYKFVEEIKTKGYLYTRDHLIGKHNLEEIDFMYT